jgi:hypothetical protein
MSFELAHLHVRQDKSGQRFIVWQMAGAGTCQLLAFTKELMWEVVCPKLQLPPDEAAACTLIFHHNLMRSKIFQL